MTYCCHTQARSRQGKSPGRLFKNLFSTLIAVAGASGIAAQAGPVFHGVSAANVKVIQNDTNNNATSVTLVPTLSINDFRTTVFGTSRADYGVQIGPIATNNVTQGILISSIADNGRDNHELWGFAGKRYGTPAVDSAAHSGSTQPGSSGIWWVPVFGDSSLTNVVSGTNQITYSFPEYNFDFSAGWFPYTKYYGGWLANSTAVNGGVNDQFIGNTNLTFGPTGVNVQQEVSGSTVINLTNFGLDARSNAVMICVGGKNEENFAVSKVNWATGSWTVTCRDDQSGGAEQDYIAWVAIPLNNTNGLIAGMFAASLNPAIGVNAVNELQNAPFTATKTGTGTYHLTIPGASPNNGVLLISGSEDGANNGDNIVMYQANGNGWDITTMDTGNGKTPTLQNFTAVNPNNPAGNLSDTVVSFVYIPAPSAGISVTPTNGLLTTQGGGTATFSVTLASVPTASVTMALQSSDPTAAALSTSTLTFLPTNYNVPQIVTITGLNNSVAAAENYTINFAQVTSDDTNYSTLTPPSVAAVNIPIGQPGIFLVPNTGLTTVPGAPATFQAVINQAPTSDVTINFTSSDTTHGGTIFPASVTFTSDNWTTQQVVTVTGVDDGIVDGNISYQINAAPAVSNDANYNGFNAGSVSVMNLETDVAGVTNSIVANSVVVPEGGTTSFTYVLTAQPVSNVTLTFASDNPGAGAVSPASITFTPANWNVPQTITLTGVANPASNADVNYNISITLASSNYGYSTLVVPNIVATTAKSVGLPSGTAVYGLGMPPVGIDGQATVSSAVNFSSGATLAFSITANADSTDVLGIRNDPTGEGIMVSGNTVSYACTSIATFSGGTSGSPLTISVNSSGTANAVAALLQSVTFSTATTNDFNNRTVQLSLNNGASIVSKAVRVGQLRVTQYQDGVDWGYGVYDSETNDEVANGATTTAYPAGSTSLNGLLVQGGSFSSTALHQVLLGFYDLVGTNAGQIPPGSTIVSADLTVNIQKSGQGWAFHRMLAPWDDTYSWNTFPYGGVDDVDDGYNQAELGYYSQMGNFVNVNNGGVTNASTAGIKIGLANVGVTPDIQAWVDGTTNYGWVLDASAPWGYDDLTTGTGFTPSQSSTPSLRPHLRVYWMPPTVSGASFQDGTNGYASGHDTEITQSTPNYNNSTLAVIWSDGADPGEADITEALFRFDNIIGTAPGQIPPGAHIETAFLNLACLSSTDCNGNGGQFFALYQPWDDTNLTWNTWNSNGQGILNDGTQAAVNPTATAGTFTLETSDYVPGGYHSFEVTADVQNWANGAANYGWGAVPWYNASTGLWGADGWGINTSKDPNISSHPQLVVYYTPTVGYVARPTLLPLVVSGSQTAVKFSGSIGTTYTVWRTDSLTGVWANVGTATVGADGTATFNDTTPLSTAAFYRVSNP